MTTNFGHSFDVFTFDLLLKPPQPATWLVLTSAPKKVQVICCCQVPGINFTVFTLDPYRPCLDSPFI